MSILKSLIIVSLMSISLFGVQTTDKLVSKYDARYPGGYPDTEWRDSVKPYKKGLLSQEGTGGSKPAYYCHLNGGGYDFSYALDMLSHSRDSGSIIDLGIDFLPDYDDSFTVEVWFRADGCPAENHQQVLWSTQSLNANGMRLFVYDWNGASGKFGVGFEARDHFGSGQVQWYSADNNGGAMYNYGQWMQCVAVYSAGAAGAGRPNMKIYTNGQLKIDVNQTLAVPSDINFVDASARASLGARGIAGDTRFYALNDRMYFDGGIALVRVYSKALTNTEITNNYNSDAQWIVTNNPYTFDDDTYIMPQQSEDNGTVNFISFSELAKAWGTAAGNVKWNPYADINSDMSVNISDLMCYMDSWLTDTDNSNVSVLYNNDTTHIMTCVSPYHAAGQAFNGSMLSSSVEETANKGINVHLLSPGLGWVPWWKSSILSMGQQYSWFYKTYKIIPNDSFCNYVYSGGDFVQDFVESCRENNLSPFISYRLNDSHHQDEVALPLTNPNSVKTISQFAYEHPEYRLSQDLSSWNERVHNWRIEQVRDYKLNFIEELCENYDIDGMELDFLRHIRHFMLDGSISVSDRKAIMTGFVSKVRTILDRTSRFGKHRYLAVRIPCDIASLDGMGIDPAAMASAGVDMFNVSNYYHIKQQNDSGSIKSMVPGSKVYTEVAFTVGLIPAAPGSAENIERLATPEMIYTAAHLAYSGGVDGVSAFNYQYYRLSGYEPPFNVYEHLSDKDWIASQTNQHYVLAWVHGAVGAVSQLPYTISNSQTKQFTVKMSPPTSGWTGMWKLRIMAANDIGTSSWNATLNGHSLTGTDDVSEPYQNPYPDTAGQPQQYRSWLVPAEYLIEGENLINITNVNAGSTKLCYIDIAIK